MNNPYDETSFEEYVSRDSHSQNLSQPKSTQAPAGHSKASLTNSKPTIKTIPFSTKNNFQQPNTMGSGNSRSDSPLESVFEFKHRGINIANLNTRHLKPTVDNMTVLLDQTNSIYIVGLCETFLNDTVDNNLVPINDSTFERNDMHKTDSNPPGKGAGILIYVSVHINYSGSG